MSRRSWLLATLALLLIATFAFGWRRAARAGPSHRELRALRDQRDGAVERVRGLIANRARLAPPESLLGQGNVVVGVPVALIQDIVKQAVTGLFGDFSLHLSEIKVHEAKPVRAKLLFGRSKIGSFVLDLNIHELSGRFAAAPPDLDFDHDRIRVKLPVQLASGGGRATVHFVWQGSGVAGRVCGDLDETREAHGTVVPEEFLLEGAFGVVFEGGKLRLRPQFDELAIRIFIHPQG